MQISIIKTVIHVTEDDFIFVYNLTALQCVYIDLKNNTQCIMGT